MTGHLAATRPPRRAIDGRWSLGDSHAAKRSAAAAEVEKRLADAKRTKLDLADRETMAKNLGAILNGPRQQHGFLTQILGDTMKHRGRYVVWPEEADVDPSSLSPWVDKYRRIAMSAAAHLFDDADRRKEILIDLVEGTSFDVDLARSSDLAPSAGGVRESLVPLYEMLRALAHSATARAGLRQVFATISRWNLNSYDFGMTMVCEDHPAGAEVTDREYWIERLPLVPMALLARFGSIPVAEGTWLESEIEQPVPVQLAMEPGLWLGIVPFGIAQDPTPVLIEGAVLAIRELGQWSPFPSHLLIDPIGASDVPGVATTVVVQTELDGPKVGELSVSQVEDADRRPLAAPWTITKLTVRSLHHLLCRKPSGAQRLEVAEQNGIFFQEPAFAHARTAAAAVERGLLHRPDDDIARLDNRIAAVALRLADAVKTCDGELRAILEAGRERFLDHLAHLQSE